MILTQHLAAEQIYFQWFSFQVEHSLGKFGLVFGFHTFRCPLHIPFGNGIHFRATVICQNQYYTTYNNEMTLKLLNPRHKEASLDFIYCHQYLTLLNTSASSFIKIL